jgi:hypothetical protein
VYLVEAGLLLVISPWTVMWQRNYFTDLLPWLGPIMETAGVRSVVVGTGIVTAIAGMSDLRAVLFSRSTTQGQTAHKSSDDPAPPVP